MNYQRLAISNKTYKTDSKSAYNKFREAYPDVNIDFKDWKKVVREHNWLFAEYILDTGDRAKLRWLGTFTIRRKKIRRFINMHDGRQFIALPIDWQKSKKAGKRIYNFNTHSDGFRYGWRWFSQDSRFHLSDIWWFKPNRVTSRTITKYIHMGPDQYDKYKQWDLKSTTELKKIMLEED